MKFYIKDINILFLFVILSFASSCTKPTDSPLGKKLVKTEFYKYSYKFGVIDSTFKKIIKRIIYDEAGRDSIKEGFGNYFMRTFIFYDSVGNPTEFTTYDSTGKTIYKKIIKYDRNGKILEYNTEDWITPQEVYKYGVIDSIYKKIIERIIYDEAGRDTIKEAFGNNYKRTTLSYDSVGNPNEFTTYDSTGKTIDKTIVKDWKTPQELNDVNPLYWREKFIYANNRVIKKLISENSSFKSFDEWIVTNQEIFYTYNGIGNVILEKVYDINTKKMQYSREYEYDSLNRYISEIMKSADSLHLVTLINKYNFDDKKNMMENVFSDDKKIMWKLIGKYDDIKNINKSLTDISDDWISNNLIEQIEYNELNEPVNKIVRVNIFK